LLMLDCVFTDNTCTLTHAHLTHVGARPPTFLHRHTQTQTRVPADTGAHSYTNIHVQAHTHTLTCALSLAAVHRY